MNETIFNISSVSQSIKVNPANISGSHDALHAYLNIPVNFTLRTLTDDKRFDILPITTQLTFQNPEQFLIRIDCALGYHSVWDGNKPRLRIEI